jgi:hypothetical protein
MLLNPLCEFHGDGVFPPWQSGNRVFAGVRTLRRPHESRRRTGDGHPRLGDTAAGRI